MTDICPESSFKILGRTWLSKVRTLAKLWTPHCAEQMGSWEGSDMVLPRKGEMLCRALSKDASALQVESVS